MLKKNMLAFLSKSTAFSKQGCIKPCSKGFHWVGSIILNILVYNIICLSRNKNILFASCLYHLINNVAALVSSCTLIWYICMWDTRSTCISYIACYRRVYRVTSQWAVVDAAQLCVRRPSRANQLWTLAA